MIPKTRPGRRARALIPLAFLPFALLVAREWSYRPDIDTSDYVQYVEHARALAEGRPYADTGYIYSPQAPFFAPRAYPPGFPMILAAAFMLFGTSLVVAKVVTLAMSVLLLVSAGVYLHRVSGGAVAWATVLLLGLSPPFLVFSLSPLSDLPFAAVLWLILVVVDRDASEPDPTPWGWGRAIAVTAAAALAIGMRPHGLVFLPALAVWGLANLRRYGWKALIPAPALIAATLAGRLLVGEGSLRTFPRVRTAVGHLVGFDIRYHFAIFESHLYPFGSDLANDVFHLFTAAVMIVGLAMLVRRRPRSFAVVFAVTYTLALGALPADDVRFAFPLFPLFIYGLVEGIRVIARLVVSDRATPIAVGFAALVAVSATARTLAAEHPPRVRDDPSFRALIDEVRGRVEAGEEMRLAVFLPRVVAVETGVRAMPLIRRRDPDVHIIEWCRLGITHVALGGWEAGRAGTVASREAMALAPDAFSIEYRNDGFALVRIDRARLGETFEACAP